MVSSAPEPIQPVRESPYKKLRVLLASEIARQELEVTETNEGTVVRIRGLFASAQDRVKQKYYPLLTRVAEGLAGELGQITVAGYTDNVPIRTIKFPSNWDLSEGRAKDVARILLSSGQLEGRVQSEGRADREPVSSNETPSGRALNRRVDIILR
ncbi:MAG: type VI secretion system protein TssL, long form [Pseudomonadales bacterium]|nr:type VI secretion system protein TssL, long form [Pseudomonadales bacterium]